MLYIVIRIRIILLVRHHLDYILLSSFMHALVAKFPSYTQLLASDSLHLTYHSKHTCV